MKSELKEISPTQKEIHLQIDAEALKAAGINSVFYVSPDTAHEFLSWRRSLREFAPLLFRD